MIEDTAMSIAVNAVAPAVLDWEAKRQQRIGTGRKLLDALARREPTFLPMSLRVGIAQAVVRALDEAGHFKGSMNAAWSRGVRVENLQVSERSESRGGRPTTTYRSRW